MREKLKTGERDTLKGALCRAFDGASRDEKTLFFFLPLPVSAATFGGQHPAALLSSPQPSSLSDTVGRRGTLIRPGRPAALCCRSQAGRGHCRLPGPHLPAAIHPSTHPSIKIKKKRRLTANRSAPIFLTIPLLLVIGSSFATRTVHITAEIPAPLFQQAQRRFSDSQEVDALRDSKERSDDQRATCRSLQERRWALPPHDAPAENPP